MRRRSIISRVVFLLCLGGPAMAARGADGDPYFDDFPVVLSASRLMQRVDEAPAAVTVIDRDMIKRSGAREVVDLFRLVPGLVVGQYKAHQPTLGYFGLTDPLYCQLQVLIDGVSIYSSAWGGAEWSELPIALDDIERIEVVRGPNAATFGANSFLGVVNIITRDPAMEQGGEVVANLGGNGIRDTHIRYARNDGDFRLRLTGGQRADAGLDSYPDSRRTEFFNLRAHLHIDGSDELRLQTAYAGGTQEDGVYGSATDGPRTAHYDSGSLQVRWTRVRSTDEEIWLQLSHSQREFRDVAPYRLLIPNSGAVPAALRGTSWDYPIGYGYDRRRTDLEMQHTTRIADSARAAWGAQLRSDGVRSTTYFSSPDWLTSSLYRLFGNLEWRPADGWIAAGGGMFEKNSITGSSFSPSVAISRELLPNHTARVRFSRARRTPTLYESSADWAYRWPAEVQTILDAAGSPLAGLPLAQSSVGNPDLKDEKVRSRELAYLVKFPEMHLNTEAHWFEHRISDLIRTYHHPATTVLGLLTGDPKYTQSWWFANPTSARVVGVAGVLRWHPLPETMLYAAGSRSSIHAEGVDAGLIEISGPQKTFSLLVSQELPAGVSVSCGYYLVGPMKSLSAGDPLPRTEKVDIRLAKHFMIGRNNAEAAIVVIRATGGAPVFDLQDISKRTSWLNLRIDY